MFCGGAAGGTYIISAISYLLFGGRIFLAGVVASVVLALISILVLLADITSIWRTPRVFLNFKSPLALGATGLSLFMISSVLTIGIMHTGLAASALYVIVWIGTAASLLTLIYPGILMGMMRAIPLWSGSGPSLLVLSSGLLVGAAVITVVGGLGNVNFNLSLVVLCLLVVYGIILLMYIIMGTQGPKAAQMSVQQLTHHGLSSIFWIGVVVIGFVIPLLLYILSPSEQILKIGSLLILIGGLLMRYSLLASGIKISMLRDDAIIATYWLDH
jgi:formate-dependent nitrite reductase membrane component NrfD